MCVFVFVHRLLNILEQLFFFAAADPKAADPIRIDALSLAASPLLIPSLDALRNSRHILKMRPEEAKTKPQANTQRKSAETEATALFR